MWGGRERLEERITKGQEKAFRSDGYVHDLDLGSGFVGILI